jgi:hypothetical protein
MPEKKTNVTGKELLLVWLSSRDNTCYCATNVRPRRVAYVRLMYTLPFR